MSNVGQYVELQLRAAKLRLTLLQPEPMTSLTELQDELLLAESRLDDLRAEADGELPDDQLGITDPLQRQLLWLIVAPHLDQRFRKLIARANDNLLYHYVDGALCQRALTVDQPDEEDEVSHFELRRQILEAVRAGGSLATHGFITHARRDAHNPLHFELVPHADVVGALLGERVLSAPLALLSSASGMGIEWHAADDDPGQATLLPNVLDSLDAVVEHWKADRLPFGRVVMLSGRPGSGRTCHARHAAVTAECGALVARMGALLTSDRDGSDALEGLCRESALHGDVLILRDAGRALAPGSPWAGRLRAILDHWPALVICCVEENERLDGLLLSAVILRQTVAWPDDPDIRLALLEETLGSKHVARLSDIDLQRLGALTPRQLRHVSDLVTALESQPIPGDHLPNEDADEVQQRMGLEAALQSQLYADTGGMARVTRPQLAMDELILPEDTMDHVLDVVAAVRNRSEVLHGWGLAKRIRRGLGLCCLFDGEPGTGKTLAAEVLAGELGLQLLRIDVSNIVDKYVGETEKHLTRIFDQAQPETSILLFDEADSLFSKRTEVKSANDHYANMSVNVLLQLIEEYEGVTVLTTNLKQSIDPAFERRIMFKIEFPMPEPEIRKRLWQHLLPEALPTAEALDFDALAEVEMSGGSMKNAIMRAAYASARRDQLLDTDALLDAAYREAAASGRLVRQDVGYDV